MAISSDLEVASLHTAFLWRLRNGTGIPFRVVVVVVDVVVVVVIVIVVVVVVVVVAHSKTSGSF